MAGDIRAVIDCAAISLHVDNNIDDSSIRKIGEQLYKNLSTYGFCYLKNHGISTFKDLVFESKKFFNLPKEDKMRVNKEDIKTFGYVAPEREKINPKRTTDTREGFVCCPRDKGDMVLPKDFDESLQAAFYEAKSLSDRLLNCLSVGMDLDKSFFAKTHLEMGKSGNVSTIRVNFYPPLQESVDPDQLRFSEHHDYGTFSLIHVYPDDVEGLEGKVPGNGEFFPIKYVPDTIVLIPGLLLQRWTADRINALYHRVVLPDNDGQHKRERFSIVYFVLPDDDAVIKPLDGSDKYEPTTAKSFIEKEFLPLYAKKN